jgi:hypothetical protein
MASRKAFLLRIDPAVLAAVQRLADDDLRSLNGEIEYLLREALRRRGRGREPAEPRAVPTDDGAPAAGAVASHPAESPAGSGPPGPAEPGAEAHRTGGAGERAGSGPAKQ